MTNYEQIRLDMGALPADAESRLHQAYSDENVHQRYLRIQNAGEEEAQQRAELNSYLAAAYALFPDEVKVVQDSIRALRNE